MVDYITNTLVQTFRPDFEVGCLVPYRSTAFYKKDTVDMIIKLLYNELTKDHYNSSEEKYSSARLKDVLFKVYQSLLTGQHVPTDYKRVILSNYQENHNFDSWLKFVQHMMSEGESSFNVDEIHEYITSIENNGFYINLMKDVIKTLLTRKQNINLRNRFKALRSLLLHNNKTCIGNNLNFKRIVIQNGLPIAHNLIYNYSFKSVKVQGNKYELRITKVEKDNEGEQKILMENPDDLNEEDKQGAIETLKILCILMHSRHPKVIEYVNIILSHIKLENIKDLHIEVQNIKDLFK